MDLVSKMKIKKQSIFRDILWVLMNETKIYTIPVNTNTGIPLLNTNELNYMLEFIAGKDNLCSNL